MTLESVINATPNAFPQLMIVQAMFTPGGGIKKPATIWDF